MSTRIAIVAGSGSGSGSAAVEPETIADVIALLVSDAAVSVSGAVVSTYGS